jgi:F0F1-type ATP synthase delta subunit
LIETENTDNLIIRYKVDRELLGGFIMECDGISWDCSLRTRLNTLRRSVKIEI